MSDIILLDDESTLFQMGDKRFDVIFGERSYYFHCVIRNCIIRKRNDGSDDFINPSNN